MPEKRRRKSPEKGTNEEKRGGVFSRKTIVKTRDLLVGETEELLSPEEGIEYEDFNEDELESVEPEYTVFDLEPCFPLTTELLVDLDTLTVEAVTPPEDAIASQGARDHVFSVQILAEFLQNELQKHNHPITPEFFHEKFLKRPKDIDDAIWRTLKENLQVSLYASGKLIDSLFLQEFTAPIGRPPKVDREDLLRRILPKYDRSSFPSFSRFAHYIYENEEEVREEWENFESFRKYLERYPKKTQQEDHHEQ